MTTTVSPDQDAIYTTVRAFVLSLISCEVVQGLGNGVPTPPGGFISMTATAQTRLSTNISRYNDPVTTVGTRAVRKSTSYAIQLDCFGPQSSDWATMIEQMWRDEYGCEMLAPNMQPLYCDEPKQMALVDGEQQYEQRWIVSAVLQFNPTVAVSQEFAGEVVVTPVSVDAEFPPL